MPDGVRVLIIGGGGVLGSSLVRVLERAGHDVIAPSHERLDLFDADTVRHYMRDRDAVFHLASKIPPPRRFDDPAAWVENDRLRVEGSRLLADAALSAYVDCYVVPTLALIYPPGRHVDESTPIRGVERHLESALAAEAQASRVTVAGRRGFALRFGVLYGPGTLHECPPPSGATLHVQDAADALAAVLDAPAGVYNVVDDGDRVCNQAFKRVTEWRPRHGDRSPAIRCNPSFDPPVPLG